MIVWKIFYAIHEKLWNPLLRNPLAHLAHSQLSFRKLMVTELYGRAFNLPHCFKLCFHNLIVVLLSLTLN